MGQELEVDLLRLVQVARRTEKSPNATPTDKAAAWESVVQHQGENPVRAEAEQKRDVWLLEAAVQHARSVEDNVMASSRQKEAAWDKVVTFPGENASRPEAMEKRDRWRAQADTEERQGRRTAGTWLTVSGVVVAAAGGTVFALLNSSNNSAMRSGDVANVSEYQTRTDRGKVYNIGLISSLAAGGVLVGIGLPFWLGNRSAPSGSETRVGLHVGPLGGVVISGLT
jgi:hypothetical protein